MTASAEILQEYLVAVGYEVNPVSYKSLTTGLTNIEKKVAGVESAGTKAKVAMSSLGWAAAAGAVALGFSAGMFATQMRKVYASSELANSSVNNMKALEKAGAAVGISSEALGESVTSLSNKIRSNPGMTQWIESLGVKVTGRDASDVALDLLGVFKQMPQFVGQQYADQMLGMDSNTYYLTIKHLDEIKAKKIEIAKTLDALTDPEKAKEVTQHYAAMLDKLEVRFTGFGQASQRALLPTFDFLVTQTDHILEGWTDIAKLASGEESWSDLVGGKKPPVDMTGFQTKEEKDRQTAFNTKFAKEHPMLAPLDASSETKEEKVPKVLNTKFAKEHPMLAPLDASSGAPTFNAITKPVSRDTGPDESVKRNNPGNLRSWGSAPTSGGFAVFDTPEAGLSAMAKNLVGYQAQGFNTIEKIISRWAPARENDTAAYIADISKKTKTAPGQQVSFQNPDFLSTFMAAITQHEHGKNPFTPQQYREAAYSGLNLQGSTKALTYSPTTTINISGGASADTKQVLQGVLDKSMSATLRNLKSLHAGA